MLCSSRPDGHKCVVRLCRWSELSECCEATTNWMWSNRLQSNPDEAEVLWCMTTPASTANTLTTDRRLFCGSSTSLWNPGIFIDCHLSMCTHVTRTVSWCSVALCQLRQIRCSVTTAKFQTPVVALAHSRLDYGNAVLAGLPGYLQRRLQSVLNTAARLILYGLGCRDHITDANIYDSTGCMFHSVSSWSWLCWLTKSCSIKHRVTLDLSSMSPTCLAGEHSALPTPTVCWCRRSYCHLSATEPFSRCTSYLERSAKYCCICSVITLFLAPPQDLSFSDPCRTSLWHWHLSPPFYSGLVYLGHYKNSDYIRNVPWRLSEYVHMACSVPSISKRWRHRISTNCHRVSCWLLILYCMENAQSNTM